MPKLRLGIVPPEGREPVFVPIQRGSVRVGFAASFADGHSGWVSVPVTRAREPVVTKVSSTAPPDISVMEWVRSHYGYLLVSGWAAIVVVLILFVVKAHSRPRRIVRNSRAAPLWARALLQRIAADDREHGIAQS